MVMGELCCAADRRGDRRVCLRSRWACWLCVTGTELPGGRRGDLWVCLEVWPMQICLEAEEVTCGSASRAWPTQICLGAEGTACGSISRA